MKILHVIGGLAPRYGGPTAAALGMCKELARRGHKVELFSTNVDGPDVLSVPIGVPDDADGFAITYFTLNRPRSRLTSIGLAKALLSRTSEFDVVHIHSMHLFHSIAAGALCRRRGVPYVVRPHGSLDPYHRSHHRLRKQIFWWLIERRNLERAAAIHCTSDLEKTHVAELRLSTPIEVVPLGIDVVAFETCNATLPSSLSELTGKKLITFLGRLTPKKGIDLLLDAFGVIASRHRESHLVIAGPDDEGLGDNIRSHAARLGLEHRVTLTGLLDWEAKAALLKASSVLALPSMDENFAISVLEAMAASTPVVITKGIAWHDVIESAQAGLIAERSPRSIANALERVLTDTALSRSLGINGRNLAASRFQWEQVGQGLESMYAKVLAAKENREN